MIFGPKFLSKKRLKVCIFESFVTYSFRGKCFNVLHNRSHSGGSVKHANCILTTEKLLQHLTDVSARAQASKANQEEC